jgi:hypothetical protein
MVFMKSIGRLSVQLVMTLVLATALPLALPVFVDRHDYSRAASNYAKNPSPENDKILRFESATYRQDQLKTHIAATGLLFIGLNAVWFLVARLFGTSSKSH